MKVVFDIPGVPQGKARPRVVRNRYSGNVVAYTPDKTVAYEELIRQRYLSAAQVSTVCELPERQLQIRIYAYFSVPKNKTKTMRRLMESNQIRPVGKPDADNIIKVICDALNHVAYKDDSQIVDIMCRKYYGQVPRVEVHLEDAVL